MPDLSTASPPLLSLLLLPLGGLLLPLLPDPARARRAALAIALGTLGLAVWVVLRFDPARPGFQLVEQAVWIPGLQVAYRVGVDGLSVLFLPLTALLFVGAILISRTTQRALPQLYFALLLLLEGATLGVFCALDTVLFLLFWELTLVPLYFLVSLWGVGPQRRYAATQYTLFMLAGGVPLLFAFLLLAINHATETGTAVPLGLGFDYTALLRTPLAPGLETTVFLLLLLGFAAKTPLFPLHTWLPVLAADAPLAVTALVTGLKLGAYGLIRFAIPLAPEAAQELHWLLAGLGVTGVLYGALGALAQSNLRGLLAYSSMSHVGLVVLGIASHSLEGIQGALLQLYNFAVVGGGLFLLTGCLHQRIGSTELHRLGGLAQAMPMLASAYLVLGLAALGLPGTSGFPAEWLLIWSILEHHTGAGLAALAGMVLAAAGLLGAYRRAFFGVPRSALPEDLRPREVALALVAIALVLAAGLYPQPVLDLTGTSAAAWVARGTGP
jgi:NADH-quinone oxidoreductase subunit M